MLLALSAVFSLPSLLPKMLVHRRLKTRASPCWKSLSMIPCGCPLRFHSTLWLWCATRFFVRAASGRKRYNVLGALHAVSHRLIRVANHSYINAESICALLRAVAQAGVGRPITLVLDNARYQKCALVQGLAASLGIHLLYLPGYSPRAAHESRRRKEASAILDALIDGQVSNEIRIVTVRPGSGSA